MNTRHAREARNQAIFREMNEWTREDDQARHGDGHRLDIYLCECGDPGCTDTIVLTVDEYEAIRSSPTTFGIAPNHENPEIDRVVSDRESYATVEAVLGEHRRIAVASNPRA